MKKQDEIEELFSSTFANFESMPSMDVKSAIDDQLFNGKPPVSGRRKGFTWIYLSIFLIGVVSFFALKNGRNNNPFLEKNKISVEEISTTVNSSLEIKKKDNSKEVSQLKINNFKKKIINKFEKDKLTQKIELNLNNATEKSSKIENYFKSETNKIHLKEQKATRYITSQTNKNSSLSINNSDTNSDSKEAKNEGAISFSQIKNKDNPSDKSEILKSPIFSNEVILDKNKEKEKLNKSVEDVFINNQNSVAENVNVQDTTQQIQRSRATGNTPALNGSNTSQIKALSPWSFSCYSGGTFGSSFLKNTSNKNYKMTEHVGFGTSIEANYSLNARFGVTAGIDMNSRKDVFYKIIPAGDTISIGYTTQLVYLNPVIQDSIIDTLYVPNYGVGSTATNQEQIIQHVSYAIPIFMSINLLYKGNWKVNLNTGLRISYVQNKLVSNPLGMLEPGFKSVGLRVNIRPEITYSLEKFGIGCYVNLGYDMIPAIQWTDVKRTRIDYGFGLALKYHL